MKEKITKFWGWLSSHPQTFKNVILFHFILVLIICTTLNTSVLNGVYTKIVLFGVVSIMIWFWGRTITHYLDDSN